MKILKIKLEIFNHNFHKYFSKINIFTAGRQYYILLLKTKVFQEGVCALHTGALYYERSAI